MGCNWEWDSWSGVMAGMQKWAMVFVKGEYVIWDVIRNGTVGVVLWRGWDSGHGV